MEIFKLLPDLSTLLSFLAASVALTLLPGPDLLYVITQSISRGAKTGFSIAIGLVSGLIIHTALAATGLSLIIYKSELAIKIVQYAGAIYLFYLAYQSYKSTYEEVHFNQEKSIKFSFWKLWRKGFLMNVLNPKVSLFFIAFFPQFIHLETGISVAVQMIVLGLLFMLQAIIIFGIISLIAGKLTQFLRSEKFWNYTKWANIILLVVLGIGLLLA